MNHAGPEQLHGVARGILDDDLFAPGAGDDLAPEPDPRLAQTGGLGLDVVDLDHETVPAAGRRLSAVGHRTRGGAAGRAEPQSQIPSRQHPERGAAPPLRLVESQVGEVEGGREIHVIHQIAHVNSHRGILGVVRPSNVKPFPARKGRKTYLHGT